MWIRYKDWRQLGLHEVRKVSYGARSYVFSKQQEGCCDVRYREDIARVLKLSKFIPAYERLGLTFDVAGREVTTPTLVVTPSDVAPKIDRRVKPAAVVAVHAE